MGPMKRYGTVLQTYIEYVEKINVEWQHIGRHHLGQHTNLV